MPVSLHTHSWYSLLEGVSAPEALLLRAAQTGHTALALTDTNNLYGAVFFLEAAPRYQVRPILGACLRQGQARCVALVANPDGYRGLCRVISRLHLSSVAPELLVRTDPGDEGEEGPAWPESGPADLVDLLCQQAEGLHILVDEPGLAVRLRDAFGSRLWLEVIRPRDGRHERELLECGRRLGLRAVASTACHFADPGGYSTFRLLTAVRRLTLLDRVPARLGVAPEHHLCSTDELRRRFHDLPEAIVNAENLAELLRSDVLPRDLILPRPPLGRHGRDKSDLAEYLRGLCERGLRDRQLGASLEARRRLREELAVVEGAGLVGYFLTVRDITRMVRRRGHTMALRGSAGNSLICYLLGITDVDPLRFKLEPERFLHPGRTDLPDIDLDFDWKVRDEVIAHVIRRYGARHTARISSHLFFQPRSAFRESGKAHGLSSEQVSALLTTLAEKVEDLLLNGSEPAPKDFFTTSETPRAFPLEPERWPRLLADARRLLGLPHLLSLHPGGIVITPSPAEDYLPLQWAAKGVVMTQYDKDGAERIGLVKIDLLGNRALATVDEGRRLARTAIPLESEDSETLELLRQGDTLGITQLESPAMRHLVVQVQPRGVEQVIQALALLRPGAASIGMKECFIRRRQGLEPVQYAHPALEGALGETYGLMLYEDDALRLVQALTGLPAAEADRFRKRVGKHDTPEEEEVLRREFLSLCARQGIPSDAVSGPLGGQLPLWTQLAKFNRYSFCKSHAVSYGLIAWQAAWLKAHHPAAFWTAVLNNNQGAYPRWVYVEAIKRAGLGMRMPCVNASREEFTLEEGGIRVGLGAVAGLARAARQAVLEERDRHGPYADLADLRRRVHLGPEALALLIRSGALDFTGRNRPALFLEAELLEARRPGSGDLFPCHREADWGPADYPLARRQRDSWELLGFVLGPTLFSLFQREAPVRGPILIRADELPAQAGRLVRVQGLVATGRHVFTEDDRPIQFVTLEDGYGMIEVTLFPGTCPQVPYLTLGPYLATGIVEERYGTCTITARAFERLW